MIGKVLTWLAVPCLALIFLGPTAGLLSQVDGGALNEVLSGAGFRKSLIATLVSAGGAAAISVIAAFFFARPFALYDWKFKRHQRLLLLIPYLVPNFILASAFVVAWNPATGLLNSFLAFPFGLYGLWGITFLFAISHLPVGFLLLEEKIRRIDPSWREAARLSGSGSRELLWRIELPLLIPTLISAFTLCFALNISAFAIPAWIGAPAKVYPLTYRVYQTIQMGGEDSIARASAYSLALLVLALPPLLLGSWFQLKERRYVMVSGKASRASSSSPRPVSFAIFQALFWLLQLGGWIAPLACLFVSTFVKPGCLQQNGLSCFSDLSLRSYRYVIFDLSETRAALHGSLVYGGIAAVLIIALSIATLILFHQAPALRRFVEWIFALPLAVPGAVIALGLILTGSGRFGFSVYNTPWILVAAFVIKHLSLAFQPLRTGISAVGASLVEAARLSGAGTRTTWTRIILPILKPECIGGFFLVLVPILGELTMSVFLTSPSARTIGTVLFDLQDYSDQAAAGALSVLLVLMILSLNAVARIASRGKLGF